MFMDFMDVQSKFEFVIHLRKISMKSCGYIIHNPQLNHSHRVSGQYMICRFRNCYLTRSLKQKSHYEWGSTKFLEHQPRFLQLEAALRTQQSPCTNKLPRLCTKVSRNCQLQPGNHSLCTKTERQPRN